MNNVLDRIKRSVRRSRDIMTLDVPFPEVRRATSAVAGKPVKLKLMEGKGGYSVFMASELSGKALFIVKVGNSFRDGVARRAIVNHHKEFSYLSPPERFEHEKKVLEALSPHDLAPRHIFSRGRVFMEEHVRGDRLFDLIKKGDDRSPQYAANVLRSITRMHELGVLHGDLHCRNVLIDNDKARFIDFEHTLNPAIFTALEMRAYDYLILLVTALAADRPGILNGAASLIRETASGEAAKAGLMGHDFLKPIAIFGYDKAILEYFFKELALVIDMAMAREASMKQKTEILRSLLSGFTHAGIRYAVIRNYRFLLEDTVCIHRDFDCLIRSGDLEKADRVLRGMGFSSQGMKKGSLWTRYEMSVSPDDRPLLVDLHLDVVREFMVPYMGAESFDRRIERGGIVTFSDEDTFVNIVVHAVITKAFMKKRYREDIARYLTDPGFDRGYAKGYLERLFGGKKSMRLWRRLEEKDFDGSLRMRSRLFSDFISRDRASLAAYASFLFKHTIRATVAGFLRPKKGMVIALLGVDGSGKSTASESIKDHVEAYFGTRCDIVYMGRGRNRALPGARAAMGKMGLMLPYADDIKREHPIKQKFLYMARDITYVIDAFARYLFFIYGRKRKRINVVTDRYAYDIVLNAQTYGLTRRFIINFYPAPDCLIYLYNSPETLFARKGQHGTGKLLADMTVLESVVDCLAAKGVRVVRIRTDGIEDTMARIRENLILLRKSM